MPSKLYICCIFFKLASITEHKILYEPPIALNSLKQTIEDMEDNSKQIEENARNSTNTTVTTSTDNQLENAPKNANNTISLGNVCFKHLEDYKFERRLIQLVRRNSALYKVRHKRFKDDNHKEGLWRNIANELSVDLTKCMSTWAELRYKYQRHVRRLEMFSCHKSMKRSQGELCTRPLMVHEEDFIYIFTQAGRYPVKKELNSDCVDVDLVESKQFDINQIATIIPEAIIDLDVDNDDLPASFRITDDIQRLIDCVRAYPILYNTRLPGYSNYRQRGMVWSSISNELHDKATKLIKTWLNLQMRYEWELTYALQTSTLIKELSFLQPHIKNIRSTVCKSSAYLYSKWHNPLEMFRTVMSLITTLKNFPEVCRLTDEYINSKNKPQRYHALWRRVGSTINCSPQRCEITWLVLRKFYFELVEMRKAGYQLQDKWFFENVIGGLYKSLNLRNKRHPQDDPSPPTAITTSPITTATATVATPSNARSSTPTPLPLAIFYPASLKSNATITTTPGTTVPTVSLASSICSISASSSPTTSTPSTTITTSSNSAGSSSSSNNTTSIPTNSSTSSTTLGVTIRALTSGPNSKPIIIRPRPLFNTKSMVIKQLSGTITPMVSPRTPNSITPILPPKPLNNIPSLGTERNMSFGIRIRPRPRIISSGIVLASQAPTHSIVRAVVPGQTSPATPTATVSSANKSSSTPTATVSSASNSASSTPTATVSSASKSSLLAPTATVSPASKSSPHITGTKTQVKPTLVSGVRLSSSSTSVRPMMKVFPKILPKLPLQTPIKTERLSSLSVPAVRPHHPPSTRWDSTDPPPVSIGSGGHNITSASSTSSTTTSSISTSLLKRTKSIRINSAEPSITINSTANKDASSSSTGNSTSLAPPLFSTATITTTMSSGILTLTSANKSGVFHISPSASAAFHRQRPLQQRELRVELLNSVSQESLLHIYGLSLQSRVQLDMKRVAQLIREIMNIPHLHCKDRDMIPVAAKHWQNVAKKFRLTERTCRAAWDFLVNNISLFPHIAPMSELMQPIKGNYKYWEKSHRLFDKFDEIARKYNWLMHKNKLPALMEHFHKYEHLYWEMRKPRPGELAVPKRKFTEEQRAEVWQKARQKFPNINHRDVWSMFKFAFKTYMEDLERGIENPWPVNWWRALEKLRFLVDVRYHPLEPYHYIVNYKFNEEVARCIMYEKSTNSRAVIEKSVFDYVKPWDLPEAKLYLTGKPTIYVTSHISPKSDDEDTLVEDSRSQSPEPCTSKSVGEHAKHTVPSVDVFELTHAMRLHPNTYGRSSTVDKRTAWIDVAKELRTNVTECRLTLQYALREFRILKLSDPACRCRLNHKYYRHMTEIYRQVKPRGKLQVRTPQDLNQSICEPTDAVYPERYIPEINMLRCPTRLVVKNWSYAIGNLTVLSQEELCIRLRQIFAKYALKAKVPWPSACATDPPSTNSSKRTNGSLDPEEIELPAKRRKSSQSS